MATWPLLRLEVNHFSGLFHAQTDLFVVYRCGKMAVGEDWEKILRQKIEEITKKHSTWKQCLFMKYALAINEKILDIFHQNLFKIYHGKEIICPSISLVICIAQGSPLDF